MASEFATIVMSIDWRKVDLSAAAKIVAAIMARIDWVQVVGIFTVVVSVGVVFVLLTR